MGRISAIAGCICVAGLALAAGMVHAANHTNQAPSGIQRNMTVKVRLLDEHGVLVAAVAQPKVVKTDAEWRRLLTPAQYQIARGKGTERAFCGAFYDHKKSGIYLCVCCKLPLFSAETKFDSGTGWPSFFAPMAAENVTNHPDLSLGMRRVEILCTRCDGHLGHVFEDGPAPSGLRYCLNSESLVFQEKQSAAKK
jgi:methionine-R-sulfoxide reductase